MNFASAFWAFVAIFFLTQGFYFLAMFAAFISAIKIK